MDSIAEREGGRERERGSRWGFGGFTFGMNETRVVALNINKGSRDFIGSCGFHDSVGPVLVSVRSTIGPKGVWFIFVVGANRRRLAPARLGLLMMAQGPQFCDMGIMAEA